MSSNSANAQQKHMLVPSGNLKQTHRALYTTHHVSFLRATARRAKRVVAIVEASVCPSVTLRYCVKTTQARITRFLLWVAAKTLVYRDKISCQ